MGFPDLIICVAYFSIPVQILVALWQDPRLASMPRAYSLLLVLFAFFIFLCGAGHLLRYMEMVHTKTFENVNIATAVISFVTAVYLIPLVPSLFGGSTQIMSLQQQNKESMESKRKLFTFMAFLCHEIRNPLFAITSSATCCLEDTILTDEQAIAVGSIMDSAVLMLRLVNDVLDLSKIDAGKLQLETKTFDLHRMLDNLAHTISRQVAQKMGGEVKFNVSIAQDVPHLVSADPVRLLQIIYNLLSNALKFTQEGRIDLNITVCSHAEAVRAGLVNPAAAPLQQVFDTDCSNNTTAETTQTASTIMHEDDEDKDDMFSMALLDSAEAGQSQCVTAKGKTIYLQISVTDTGEGIEADRIATIFEPYSQAKLSDYRKHGGTGLGLSIISGLTKAMGGKIKLTSTVQVGSSFVVQMPINMVEVASGDGKQQPNIQTSPPFDNTKHQQPFQDDILNDHGPLKLSCMRLPNFKRSANDDSSLQSFYSTDSAQINLNNSVNSFSADDLLLHNSLANGSNNNNDHSNGQSSLSKDLGTVVVDNSSNDSSSSLRSSYKHKSQSTFLRPQPTPKTRRQKLKPLVLTPNDHVVLIVDDNTVNQKIIAKMLSHFQVEYRVASNGQEAVDYFVSGKTSRNLHPDRIDLPRFALVLMDLSMPIKDGYQAIQELRQCGVTIPIVALTANALQQERDRAAAVGATDFQTKPILRNDLYAVCKRYLETTTRQEMQTSTQQQTMYIT
jgi:signal transduction histidine kinase/CheY-like chemotaxis protein